MPFVFAYNSAAAGNLLTSATPNTEVDNAFVSTGTGANVALAYGLGFYVGGKSAGLTVISSIAFRIRRWSTTASSGGLAASTTQRDPGYGTLSGAQLLIGFGNPVTSGTGGPNFMGAFVCGATGPGGWVSPMLNSMPKSGDADSIDLFSSSATPSLPFESTIEVHAAIP